METDGQRISSYEFWTQNHHIIIIIYVLSCACAPTSILKMVFATPAKSSMVDTSARALRSKKKVVILEEKDSEGKEQGEKLQSPAPPEKVESSSEATESDGEEEAPQSKKHKAKAEKKEETDSDEDKPLGLRRNMADSPGGEVTPSLLFPNLKIADKDDKFGRPTYAAKRIVGPDKVMDRKSAINL